MRVGIVSLEPEEALPELERWKLGDADDVILQGTSTYLSDALL